VISMLLPKLLQTLRDLESREERERRGVQVTPRAGILRASFFSSAGALSC
jgi:hypothetical protein